MRVNKLFKYALVILFSVSVLACSESKEEKVEGLEHKFNTLKEAVNEQPSSSWSSSDLDSYEVSLQDFEEVYLEILAFDDANGDVIFLMPYNTQEVIDQRWAMLGQARATKLSYSRPKPRAYESPVYEEPFTISEGAVEPEVSIYDNSAASDKETLIVINQKISENYVEGLELNSQMIGFRDMDSANRTSLLIADLVTLDMLEENHNLLVEELNETVLSDEYITRKESLLNKAEIISGSFVSHKEFTKGLLLQIESDKLQEESNLLETITEFKISEPTER